MLAWFTIACEHKLSIGLEIGQAVTPGCLSTGLDMPFTSKQGMGRRPVHEAQNIAYLGLGSM